MKTLSRYLGYALLVLLLLVVGYGVANYRADRTVADLLAQYGTPESKFLAVDGLQVHYRDEGPRADTVPLVLIHGTGASLLTWDGWVSALKAKKRIVRLDLPAYGLTGPNTSDTYSGSYYADFLASFLTKAGIRQCDVAGNSLGGFVAWQFALAHPERVRKLVLIDAAGYPLQSQSVPLAFQIARMPILKEFVAYITPRSVIEQSIKNVYADPTKVSDQLIDQYLNMTLRAGNRRAFVSRINQKPDSLWQRIGQINTPTLVLWGAEDRLIPISNAARFHQDLPNDTLVVLPKAGHVPMEEAPKQTAEIVWSFLKTTAQKQP
jgi:pimeloyl-ACP methyl ester carboxylesterase